MSVPQRLVHGRRAARMAALQVLFEVDTAGHKPEDVLARRIVEDALAPEAAAYATDLVYGVLQHVDAIDERIQRAAPAWPFSQMAGIDRNVIRIALYEALFGDEKVPFKVAVNEAVELAKLFGSESSSRFVNGVVGRIVSEDMAREETDRNEGDEPPAS